MKNKIYNIATSIYDLQIPLVTLLADKIRDLTYEED